jgi:GrpB-like predicted nucleotidyltransferase (UPF0157 family)
MVHAAADGLTLATTDGVLHDGPLPGSHDPTWPSECAKEQTSILDAAGEYVRVIEHIGSTAVVRLAAKPVIDIAVGVGSVDAVQSHVVGTLEPLGYKLFDAGMAGAALPSASQRSGISSHRPRSPSQRRYG